MAKKNELTHLAIILDGNGRWAEKHGVPRVEGHKAGPHLGGAALRAQRHTRIFQPLEAIQRGGDRNVRL